MHVSVSNSLGKLDSVDGVSLNFETLLVKDEAEEDGYASIPFEIPRTVDKLYEKWHLFIISRLRKFGLNHPDHIEDMAQSIYTHFHAKSYLNMYDYHKGSFKNFLTIGIRNYLFNWYQRQTRDPLRWADTIVESLGNDQELQSGFVSLDIFDSFQDTADRGDIMDAKVLIADFESFLKAQGMIDDAGKITGHVVIKNGQPLSPWHVFNCVREGLRTKDMATIWGITAGAVSNYKRYLRLSLQKYLETGSFLTYAEFH